MQKYHGIYFLTTITSFYLTSFIHPYTCSLSFIFSLMQYNVLREIPYIHFIMKIFSAHMNVHIQEDCENSEILLFMLMPLTIFPPILVTHTMYILLPPTNIYVYTIILYHIQIFYSVEICEVKWNSKLFQNILLCNKQFSQGKIVEMNIVCVYVCGCDYVYDER